MMLLFLNFLFKIFSFLSFFLLNFILVGRELQGQMVNMKGWGNKGDQMRGVKDSKNKFKKLILFIYQSITQSINIIPQLLFFCKNSLNPQKLWFPNRPRKHSFKDLAKYNQDNFDLIKQLVKFQQFSQRENNQTRKSYNLSVAYILYLCKNLTDYCIPNILKIISKFKM